MDLQDGLSARLSTLLIGLADQKIKDGAVFLYDGGRLYGSDVADIMLPCALVIADALSRGVSMGGCGYEFEVGSPNPVFPVHAIATESRQFGQVAPFLTEVFDSVVFPLRNDLAQVYALAVDQLGMVLEGGYEPQEADVMPVMPAAVIETQRAAMVGGAGIGR